PRPRRGARLARRVLELTDPVGELLRRLGAGGVGGRLERRDLLIVPGIRAGAGPRLDPAHSRPDRALAGDDEPADLARRPGVRPAAELVGVVVDADRPDGLAVLLVEERVGAGVDRLLHRHVAGRDRPVLADDPADLVLDRVYPSGRQGGVEREVEAEPSGRQERAGLAGALADDVAEGPVEDVRAGVVA